MARDEMKAGKDGYDEDEADEINGRSGMRNKDYSCWLACEEGDTDTMKFFLEAGADPNAKVRIRKFGEIRYKGYEIADGAVTRC